MNMGISSTAIEINMPQKYLSGLNSFMVYIFFSRHMSMGIPGS